jgi:hypothetical protein
MRGDDPTPVRPLRRPGLQLDAVLDRLRGLDPRVRLAAGAVAVLVIVGAIAGLALSGSRAPTVAQPSASATRTAEPSATPPRPRTTPPGTPAPKPKTFVGLSASIPVSPPPAPRTTERPESTLWRIDGYMVDEQGAPIEGVCVVIGPVGCQPFSPHTDERGYYFLDVAAVASETVQVDYDFYFEYPGRETLWLRLRPRSFSTFNAVMKRT